jgi:hypothetical protein
LKYRLIDKYSSNKRSWAIDYYKSKGNK